MPDLKFKGGKFYFSILNPSDSGHSLLTPRITNPQFAINGQPPGIKELIEGDLGITEKIMLPVLQPLIDITLANPLLSEAVANANQLEASNKEAISAQVMNNYIPKDSGMKALEKTVISSMMESHKPLMDFLRIFLETIGVAEDVFCRFLGTSIKILGKEIGLPSRNPAHWNNNLNYSETMTHALQKFIQASEDADAEFVKSMSNDNPIKKNVPSGNSSNIEGNADQDAFYIGYFDEDGNSITPPKWVLDSNKWFKRDIPDKNGNIQTISAPFEQLSPNLNLGAAKLAENQQKNIDRLNKEKMKMIQNIDERISTANEIKIPSIKREEIKSLNKEKKEASELFDTLIISIQDLLDGTNKGGDNYIDPEDKSKGINPPAPLSEWMGKLKSSQLRQKYFPTQKTTVQSIIDKKGKGVDPYVRIPEVRTKYKGKDVGIQVPLAYDNQISTEKVISSNLFFDTKMRDKKLRNYSNINKVSSLDIFYGTDRNQPYYEDNKTHFTREIKKEYVPDNLKNYFLPLEWEEVFEYDIKNKRTGEIVRKETEIVPFKIDVENDYELRLIKVVNRPLNKNGINKEFFSVNNIKIINSLTNLKINTNLQNNIQNEVDTLKKLSPIELNKRILEGTIDPIVLESLNLTKEELYRRNFYNDVNISRIKKLTPNTETGTLFADSNNIPDKYNLQDPSKSKHSPLDINEKNGLKEGIIYQGLDPRFVEKDKYQVFWLVEAIKKNDDDVAPINGVFNDIDKLNISRGNRSSGVGGKEWYGLIDKFTAIPQIASKLIPIIASKLIPLAIKIIQLISNPTKIKQFILDIGLTQESASKFPQNYKDFGSKGEVTKIKKLKSNDIPKTIDEQENNGDLSGNNYYMGIQEGVENPTPISMLDGQALTEFGHGAFGKSIVNIGIEMQGGEFKEINKKTEQKDFNKPAPKKEQPQFTFVLNMMKLPLEIIFKIFKWIINWIKKLLNPTKIPGAMAEFLSFKWLLNILGKDSLFSILGIKDIDNKIKDKLYKNSYGQDGQDLFDQTLKALRGGDQDFLEVLIYDILINGKKVRTEVVEKPFKGNPLNENINNIISTSPEANDIANDLDPNDPLSFCGVRFFNIKEIMPIPFLPLMPSYNACEVPQIFLKPLEMITGFLKFLQEIINAFLSMPSSILGLEPTIKIPRLGDEIPFANVLEDLLNGLKSRITPINMNG